MIKAELFYDDKSLTLHLNKSTIAEALYVFFQEESTPQYRRLRMDIHPKQDVVLKKLTVEWPLSNLQASDLVFGNGFQSASLSRAFRLDESWFKLPFWAKSLTQCGDYDPKIAHSWSFGYVKRAQTIDFFGSLNESTGLTRFDYDLAGQKVTVSKDLSNLHLSHSFPALDIFLSTGNPSDVLSLFAKLRGEKAGNDAPARTWSSGQIRNADFSQNDLIEHVDAARQMSVPIDHVFIENGWQKKSGDWLTLRDNLGRDWHPLSTWARQQGLKLGLTFAPFLVAQDSELFRQKPHWLLKNHDNQLITVVDAEKWSPVGAPYFAILDFFNQDVRDYLSGVVHTFLHQWRFDTLRFEQLFLAALATPANKTRGQVLSEVSAFFRVLMGEKTFELADFPVGLGLTNLDNVRFGQLNANQNVGFWLKKTGFRALKDEATTLHNALSLGVLNHYLRREISVYFAENARDLPFSEAYQIVQTVLGNAEFYAVETLVKTENDVETTEKKRQKRHFSAGPTTLKLVSQVGSHTYQILFDYQNRTHALDVHFEGARISVHQS